MEYQGIFWAGCLFFIYSISNLLFPGTDSNNLSQVSIYETFTSNTGFGDSLFYLLPQQLIPLSQVIFNVDLFRDVVYSNTNKIALAQAKGQHTQDGCGSFLIKCYYQIALIVELWTHISWLLKLKRLSYLTKLPFSDQVHIQDTHPK